MEGLLLCVILLHKSTSMSARSILITGITGHLGRSLASYFLEKGFIVSGLCRSAAKGRQLLPSEITLVETDLQDAAQTREAVQEVIRRNEKIDILVAAAGGFSPSSLQKMTEASVQDMINTNFVTALHSTQPVFDHMMSNGYGRLFLIGSQAGLQAAKASGAVAYGMSKLLVSRLAEQYNLSAKGQNVVTSVIVPSTIDTADNRQAMPDQDFSRWVSPTAIAHAIYFYSSEEADQLREPVIKAYHNAG